MTPPRLLLFGSPGAGKSSLLGALAQAAELESPALKGKLVEKSGELEKLQKSTYQGKSEATPALEAYDIRLDGDAAAAATLLDCSGKDADALLNAEQPFADRHPMNRPILDADAVLLVVDASQPSKQLNDEFQQFGRWLNHLHETRGRRVDVGDLPVYLILTKCDQLAKKDDTFAMWLQRIDEGKRKLSERFQASIKDQGTGFGSLDVKLWATSIRRPALADRPGKATEPYGVAELFRESLDAAADFQHRRQTSGRRLQNVTVGLVGLLAMLFFFVAFLFEYQPDRSVAELDARAQRVLPKTDKPAVRVGGTREKLDEKRQALAAIQNDANFTRLTSESQEAVAAYAKEIDDYLKLKTLSETQIKLPVHALKSEKDFAAQEKIVQGFAVPKEWDDTPLGKRVHDCRKQYERLREELKTEEAWLLDRRDTAEKHKKEGYAILIKFDRPQAEAWHVKYKELRQARRTLGSAMIPGVKDVTYEHLGRFAHIEAARQSWDKTRLSLDNVAKDIQAELGATP